MSLSSDIPVGDPVRHLCVYRCDLELLLSVFDAYEAALDSLVSYEHVEGCPGAECACPDAYNPILGPLYSVLALTGTRVLGEGVWATVGRRAIVVGDDLAEVLISEGVRVLPSSS